MINEEKFYVNYYIGPLLAQAGELRVDDIQIIFTPTGPIERAMGAKGVTISIAKIIIFETVGGLSRTVRIKTAERVYKFEGSDANHFGEWLIKKMPDRIFRRPPAVKLLHPFIGPKYSCSQCTEVLQPGLSFCTRCGARPDPVCAGCSRLVDTSWLMCGYCGAKITLPNL